MDSALQQTIEAAFDSHRNGDLETAELYYRRFLAQAPENCDVLNNLGLLRHQRGDLAEAEALIAQAIKGRPEAPAFHENLAAIQRARGSLPEVIATCTVGRSLAPSPRLDAFLLEALIDSRAFLDALALIAEIDSREQTTAAHLTDRAFCLSQLGHIAEASTAARRSLAIEPATPNAISTLAETYGQCGDNKDSLRWWRRALNVNLDWPAARINLGLALLANGDASKALTAMAALAIPSHDPALASALLNARSAAYRKLGRRGPAFACVEDALRLVPASAEYLNNMSELVRHELAARAMTLSDRSLACDAGYAAAHNNKGLALEELDRLTEAVASLRQAIALRPNDMEFLNNIASPLRWLGFFLSADVAHRRALAVDPNFAAGRYGLGTVQLALGELSDGWVNYDSRIRDGQIVKPRPFHLPFWQGPEQSARGPILVWGEQGLGDEIVYGSMLPALEHNGIRAVVECDARMVEVFERAMPSLEFVARTDPPNPRLAAGDLIAQLPMGSLGRWYRRRLADFPRDGAYLRPRPDLVAYWRKRLETLGDGPKVGFAWRSRRTDGVARRFHPPVLEWVPVLAQAGATFISLQYGEAEADLRAVERETGTTVHQLPGLDLMDDMDGIIALSAALDMAISTRTTAFCLPAAIGLPVWLLAPENDFLALGTDGYPWFPNVRLYRHRHMEAWSSTIGRMGRDFAAFLREPAGHAIGRGNFRES